MNFELSIINGKTVFDVIHAHRAECIDVVRDAYAWDESQIGGGLVPGQGTATPTMSAAKARFLQLWILPYGVIKAAVAAGDKTKLSTENGASVLTYPLGGELAGVTVKATLDAQLQVAKVETRSDDPNLADLVTETEYSGYADHGEIATDVLIIEDETFIAMDIEALVESLGHKVIDIARTHSEAVALAKQKRPGLILADIQLADGSSGLDAVNELLGSFEVPVIFITAYPERFLTGQRPEPAFLIAKPFQLAVVSAVVSQALFFGRKARQRGRYPLERQPTA